MSEESPLFTPNIGSMKRPALRPFFLASVLTVAAVIAWLLWPTSPEISPFDLSRADGRSHFYATTYSRREEPLNLSLRQRLFWTWMEFRRCPR